MRYYAFALLILALFAAAARSAADREPLVGGWSKIENLSDPHLAEIANFALTEHNKQANSKLGLGRIVKGEQQTVAGTNYKLVIEAKVEGQRKARKYEVMVWERLWENFLQLTSFKPLK